MSKLRHFKKGSVLLFGNGWTVDTLPLENIHVDVRFKRHGSKESEISFIMSITCDRGDFLSAMANYMPEWTVFECYTIFSYYWKK